MLEGEQRERDQDPALEDVSLNWIYGWDGMLGHSTYAR